MTTVMYNCKQCKRGKRVEYTAGRVSSGRNSWPYRLDENGNRVLPGTEQGDGICQKCNLEMDWRYLKATLVLGHVCGAKCLHARGPLCACSCGGVNHGAGWASQSLTRASQAQRHPLLASIGGLP